MDRLENLCFTAKKVLNLEEASAFLDIAKSTIYKMTHLNRLPYFKPAGKLIFFEKQTLLDWMRGAKALLEEKLKKEAAYRLNEMNRKCRFMKPEELTRILRERDPLLANGYCFKKCI